MIANDRHQEKESMAEFIAKKREVFLVQMSLDTKREEIRKLEEKARRKEEALRKSEQARGEGRVITSVNGETPRDKHPHNKLKHHAICM